MLIKYIGDKSSILFMRRYAFTRLEPVDINDIVEGLPSEEADALIAKLTGNSQFEVVEVVGSGKADAVDPKPRKRRGRPPKA